MAAPSGAAVCVPWGESIVRYDPQTQNLTIVNNKDRHEGPNFLLYVI
jgi:hypothetical protein